MITSIKLTDVRCFASMEIKAGTVNILRGANGTGKSTILLALEWLMAGGYDESLIRHGANKCSVEIVLDDGTKFRKEQWSGEKKRYELVAFGADGRLRSAPKKLLETHIDALAADPEALLRMKPRDRVAALLKRIPVEFAAKEISSIFAGDTAVAAPLAPMGLADFVELVKGCSERRREISRRARDVEGAIATQRESLAPDDLRDHDAELAAANAEVADVVARIRTADAEGQIVTDAAKAEVRAEFAPRVDAAVAACVRLRAELAAAECRATEVQEECARAVAAAAQSASERHLAAVDALRGQRGQADEKVRRLHAEVKNAAAQGALRHAIQRSETELRGHISREMALTKCLERARDAKAAKLEALPVDGLDIDGETITVGGVALDDLSTAQRKAIAYAICQVGSATNSIVIMDSGQDFDPDNLKDFIATCSKRGQQVFIEQVSEGDFTVETKTDPPIE